MSFDIALRGAAGFDIAFGDIAAPVPPGPVLFALEASPTSAFALAVSRTIPIAPEASPTTPIDLEVLQ